MSHFSLLVITDSKPTADQLEKIMMPFHEFECTGINEYIQNVDITAEAREQYNKDTTHTITRPDGSVAYPYNSEGNYNEEFSPFFDNIERKLNLPAGYSSCYDQLAKDFQEFPQWASDYYGLSFVGEHEEPDIGGDHKYGWVRVSDDNGTKNVIELIDRTNPNKQWDWWKVGGRWSGFFTPKEGLFNDKPEKGTPGIMGSERNAAGVDIARKDMIDFDSMRNTAGIEASKLWHKVHGVVGDSLINFIPWEKMREEIHPGDIKAARDAYHNQLARKLISQCNDEDFSWIEIEDFMVSHDEHVESKRLSSIATFAVIQNGEWLQKGQMGWFATVSNEDLGWHKKFNEIIDDLPDSAWLTVIDCHI